MLRGNIKAAIRLLHQSEPGGVLPLTSEVFEKLKEKHPPPSAAQPEVLLTGEVPYVDPAQFNNIDEAVIAKAALKTRGAAGPSGADADQWRRMLISKNYATVGKDLRTAIAKAARKLCTVDLAQDNPNNLSTIKA